MLLERFRSLILSRNSFLTAGDGNPRKRNWPRDGAHREGTSDSLHGFFDRQEFVESRVRPFGLKLARCLESVYRGPTSSALSSDLLGRRCRSFFCLAHEIVDPVLEEHGIEMEFFAGHSYAFFGQPVLQLILVLGELLADSLFIDALQ